MSYVNAYKVSTCHKSKETTAIVQSGNSRAAVRKFMFHVYPELYHENMEKMSSGIVNGVKITNYRFPTIAQNFTVSVEKINLTSDFIIVDQHFIRSK